MGKSQKIKVNGQNIKYGRQELVYFCNRNNKHINQNVIRHGQQTIFKGVCFACYSFLLSIDVFSYRSSSDECSNECSTAS